MRNLGKGIWMVGVPLAFSAAVVIKHSVVMFILCILVHFLVLKLTPGFKHCENIGMFVIVAFSTIPINFYVLGMLAELEVFFDSVVVVNILRGSLYYAVLLSIEEVIMGVLTRWIWKKQAKYIPEDEML